MEFFLTLACLYGAQCFVRLETSETLGLRWRFPPDRSKGRSRLFRGGGWRLAHPWPAAFVWSGRSGIPTDPPATRVDTLRAEIAIAWRRTRALRWLSSLQLVWILVLGPTGAILIGPETTLLFLAGPAIGLHLIGITFLYRAQRTVLPGDENTGDRLLIAALYPPSLIRSGADLVRLAFADRHIVELASAILSTAEFERLLRSEIGRAKSPIFAETPDERSIDWLLSIAEQRSIGRESILAPRPREDPTAESYCEFCGGDYLAGYQYCRECQLETTSYSTPTSPSHHSAAPMATATDLNVASPMRTAKRPDRGR